MESSGRPVASKASSTARARATRGQWCVGWMAFTDAEHAVWATIVWHGFTIGSRGGRVSSISDREKYVRHSGNNQAVGIVDSMPCEIQHAHIMAHTS